MKKKNLTLLLTSLLMGLMLTGCSNKPEKVTVEIEPTTEVSTEVEEQLLIDEEPTVTPAEPITEEATDDTVEVEIVEDGTTVSDEQVEVGDYLTENGITITPQGTHVMQMADYGADTTHDREVEIKVEIVPAEEGYSNTILTAIVDTKIGANFNSSWGVYDRYTGYDLTALYEGKDKFVNEDANVESDGFLEIDGTQYDCSVTFNADTSNAEYWKVTLTVHHPAEYDGVVFKVGKLTATMQNVESSLPNEPRKLMDYPELLDQQYFFTATDN